MDQAMVAGKFTPFRMTPLLRTRRDFSPRSREKGKVEAHFLRLPEGTELPDALQIMQESVGKKILREPRDIREVLALGPLAFQSQRRALAIIAPELVDPNLKNLILKLERWPDWMGLIPNTWDPEHDSFEEFEFVAFSDVRR